jgi:hypothetical protein
MPLSSSIMICHHCIVIRARGANGGLVTFIASELTST